MIDVDLRLSVGDGRRRFALDAAFASAATAVALYGPSGAGKTLALQAIAGLLRPASGHVRLGGRVLFDAGQGVDVPVARRGLGYLFQNYALFPHLDVWQNVTFGLTSWRKRLPAVERERVEGLLASFGLSGVARSRPAALSGGQQQRVALARALACEPRALLLDEPFAALNPRLRRTLRDDLAAWRRQLRIPMVIITHDVDDVLALADEAFFIDEGRVTGRVDLRRGDDGVPAADAVAALRRADADLAAHAEEEPLDVG